MPRGASAVAALAAEVDPGGGRDGSQPVLCLVPNERAAERVRRAWRTEGARDASLRTVTPERLLPELVEPEIPRASRAERAMAWLRALREAAADVREPLLFGAASSMTLAAWHDLAREIVRLEDETTQAGLDFHEVAETSRNLQQEAEATRWAALAAIAGEQRRRLREAGRVDPLAADRAALDLLRRDPARARAKRAVILAVPWLPRTARECLDALGDRVTAMVFAPEELADRFDRLGCVRVDHWIEAAIEIEEETLEVLPDATAQARAAVERVSADGRAAEIAIGLGREETAAAIERAAMWTDLRFNPVVGTPLRHTPPMRLVEAAAAFLEQRRFATLAELLRHPDVERWCIEQASDLADRASGVEPPSPSAEAPAGARSSHEGDVGVEAWLTALHDYFDRYLHEKYDGTWLGHADEQARMRCIWEVVHRLLEPLGGDPRPFSEWGEPVREVLRSVYAEAGEDEPDATNAAPSVSARAALRLIDATNEVFATRAPGLDPEIGAAEALKIFGRELEHERLGEGAGGARGGIDLLPWTDLLFDEKPRAMVVGLNEGEIPRQAGGDAFLTDLLRRKCGLLSNDERHAADAYRLCALRASRTRLDLFASRRAARMEPAAPSRLLLTCDGEALLRRVGRFCEEEEAADGTPRPPGVPLGAPACGGESRFRVPTLPNDLRCPASLPVSAFRMFLACPYRFALTYLLRLEERGEGPRELDAATFGTIAHDVLQRFGLDGNAREESDAERIEMFLLDALEREVLRRYGRNPLPAVRLQAARLRQRLRDFARFQAKHRAAGWEITHVEFDLGGEGSPLEMPDGAPMTIRGRIDRIDRHADDGRVLILDYKTGDRPKSPHRMHHGRDTLADPPECEWRDLQLPLYEHLARRNVVSDGESIRLGYVVLPQSSDGTNLLMAEWTEDHLAAAVETAREVVRAIRAGEFPVESNYDGFFDPYARICQTASIARFAEDEDEDEEGEEA